MQHVFGLTGQSKDILAFYVTNVNRETCDQEYANIRYAADIGSLE